MPLTRRIKITLSYDGTHYAGWQVQKGQSHVKTIQGTLQQALSLITQEPQTIIGAGRTDAGVHAQAQVFHFDTNSRIPPQRFPPALNSILPQDIRCHHGELVNKDFHAQFSAREKTYRYTLDNGPVAHVFTRDFAHHIPYHLDLRSMKKAGTQFIGTQDFTSFCAAGSSVKTFERTIKELEIQEEQPWIYVNITGDGFLYNMIRIIVGTLIEIGRGKISPEEIGTIIGGKDRGLAGPTAPAKGLCLKRIKY